MTLVCLVGSEDSNLSDEENYSEELDSDESSGKDWSDLEAEAAESDENRLMSTYVVFSLRHGGEDPGMTDSGLCTLNSSK